MWFLIPREERHIWATSNVISSPWEEHLRATERARQTGWQHTQGHSRPAREITTELDLPEASAAAYLSGNKETSTRSFSKTVSCRLPQTWLLSHASESPGKKVRPWGIHFNSIAWLEAGESKFRSLSHSFRISVTRHSINRSSGEKGHLLTRVHVRPCGEGPKLSTSYLLSSVEEEGEAAKSNKAGPALRSLRSNRRWWLHDHRRGQMCWNAQTRKWHGRK